MSMTAYMKKTSMNNSHGLLKRAGFTLIELLVVISIIGLLSTIILAAVQGARTKGKEAVIISELVQFRNLYETAYSTYGNYGSLQPSAFNTCTAYSGSTGYLCAANSINGCSYIYGTGGDITNSSFSQSALTLCDQIVNDTGGLYIGLPGPTINNQQYSLWALLPYQNKYMCFGSSKNNSSTSSSPISAGSTSPGCPGNP